MIWCRLNKKEMISKFMPNFFFSSHIFSFILSVVIFSDLQQLSSLSLDSRRVHSWYVLKKVVVQCENYVDEQYNNLTFVCISVNQIKLFQRRKCFVMIYFEKKLWSKSHRLLILARVFRKGKRKSVGNISNVILQIQSWNVLHVIEVRQLSRLNHVLGWRECAFQGCLTLVAFDLNKVAQ